MREERRVSFTDVVELLDGRVEHAPRWQSSLSQQSIGSSVAIVLHAERPFAPCRTERSGGYGTCTGSGQVHLLA